MLRYSNHIGNDQLNNLLAKPFFLPALPSFFLPWYPVISCLICKHQCGYLTGHWWTCHVKLPTFLLNLERVSELQDCLRIFYRCFSCRFFQPEFFLGCKIQDIILISGNRYYVMNLVLAGRARETLSGPQVRPTPPIVQSRRRPAWSSCSDIWARHQIVRDVSSFVFFLLISFTMSEVKVQVFTDFDGTLSLDGKLPFRNRKHKHRVVLGFSLSSGINRYWSYVDRRSPFSWPRAPSWVGTLDPYR